MKPSFGSNNVTKINIDNITLNVSCIFVSDNLTETLSSLTLSNADEYNENNLVEILKKIKEMLFQYFKTIIFTINKITIEIINHDTITLTDIIINNNEYKINKISFGEHFIVTNFSFTSNEKQILSIDSCYLNTEIYSKIPEFYMEMSKSNLTLYCNIQNFIVNNLLLVKNIGMLFDNKQIFINHIGSIDIDEILSGFIEPPKNLTHPIIINQNNNSCKFNGSQIFSIFNRTKLKSFCEKIINHIKLINEKIIIIGDDQNKNDFKVENINLVIIENNTKYEIVIESMLSDHINNIVLITDNGKTISKIIKFNPIIQCCSVELSQQLGHDFNAKVDNLSIISNDNNQTILEFNNGKVNGLTSMIQYISSTINKLFPKNDDNNDSQILINLKKINFIHKIVKPKTNMTPLIEYNIDFYVVQSMINIKNIILNNTIINIYLNTQLILTIHSSHINETEIIVQSVKTQIDPKMFDNLNYIVGSLNNIDSDNQQRMTNSVIAKNIDEFDSIINSFNKNSLSESFHVICSIIEDYKQSDDFEKVLSLKVSTICVNIHDNLSKLDNHFASIVVKDIDFKKHVNNNICKYGCKIKSLAIVDLKTTNPNQKYFLKNKFSNEIPFMRSLLTINDGYHSRITMSPLLFNINEETLMHMLSFLSDSYKYPFSDTKTNIKFVQFVVDNINITLNYYPMIMNKNIISLKNCELSLSRQDIMNQTSISIIMEIISNNWKKELKIFNMIQFIPNINVIQPIASPISNLYHFLEKYFGNPYNKRKLRDLISGISTGMSIGPTLIRKGFTKLIDFFL